MEFCTHQLVLELMHNRNIPGFLDSRSIHQEIATQTHVHNTGARFRNFQGSLPAFAHERYQQIAAVLSSQLFDFVQYAIRN